MLLKLMVLPLLLMPPTLSCTVSFVANAAETNGVAASANAADSKLYGVVCR
ncbi:MAG: hypothetical protein IJS05_07850 [Paludibacteraceae bacterium]|nr:hypothetical protein [Paludibacteraceae bacterium]